MIRTYEEVDLLGNVTVKEIKRGDIDKRRKGARKGEQAFAGQRREVIPLADLSDWLDFAEALLGTHDVPAGVAGRVVRLAGRAGAVRGRSARLDGHGPVVLAGGAVPLGGGCQ